MITYFDLLPDDLLRYLLKYLDPCDFIKLIKVIKKDHLIDIVLEEITAYYECVHNLNNYLSRHKYNIHGYTTRTMPLTVNRYRCGICNKLTISVDRQCSICNINYCYDCTDFKRIRTMVCRGDSVILYGICCDKCELLECTTAWRTDRTYYRGFGCEHEYNMVFNNRRCDVCYTQYCYDCHYDLTYVRCESFHSLSCDDDYYACDHCL